MTTTPSFTATRTNNAVRNVALASVNHPKSVVSKFSGAARRFLNALMVSMANPHV